MVVDNAAVHKCLFISLLVDLVRCNSFTSLSYWKVTRWLFSLFVGFHFLSGSNMPVCTSTERGLNWREALLVCSLLSWCHVQIWYCFPFFLDLETFLVVHCLTQFHCCGFKILAFRNANAAPQPQRKLLRRKMYSSAQSNPPVMEIFHFSWGISTQTGDILICLTKPMYTYSCTVYEYMQYICQCCMQSITGFWLVTISANNQNSRSQGMGICAPWLWDIS